jgi:hypothetical protein
MTEPEQISTVRPLRERIPLLLCGILLFLAGMTIYVLTIPVWIGLYLLSRDGSGLMHLAVSSSAVLIWAGILASAGDLYFLLPLKRRQRRVEFAEIVNRKVSVVLTAYNDELSIGKSVRDFAAHPLVQRVVVVDNNSTDDTAKVAAEAGAQVVFEPLQGYGRCVYRALREGVSFTDTQLTLLCEGDMTFRAYDVDKLMSYAPHAEIVNGTRIVEQLRSKDTQLTTFMYYGNFFVGKLLEAKHIGQGTYTLLPRLNPGINLEFNAHFLDTAIANRFRVLECPVTFHNRVGTSKGGNKDDLRALLVGMRMIKGILFGWPKGH